MNELDHLTPRAFYNLPLLHRNRGRLPILKLRKNQGCRRVVIKEWRSYTNDTYFILYIGRVVIGEFGFYRMGPLDHRLVARASPTLEAMGIIIEGGIILENKSVSLR